MFFALVSKIYMLAVNYKNFHRDSTRRPRGYTAVTWWSWLVCKCRGFHWLEKREEQSQ